MPRLTFPVSNSARNDGDEKPPGFRKTIPMTRPERSLYGARFNLLEPWLVQEACGWWRLPHWLNKPPFVSLLAGLGLVLDLGE